MFGKTNLGLGPIQDFAQIPNNLYLAKFIM